MAFTHELKKTVTDATPVYAVVGVTDLAAEKLRAARTQARTQAAAAGKTITAVTPKTVQKQVQDVPAVVLERSLELAGKAQGQYDAFAARGEELVKKIRTQKPTQDLVAQAEQTVAIGKGAVTTVRKAVSDTQASAKATITTGRHQAVRVAGVVNDVVQPRGEGRRDRRGRRRGRHSGRRRQDRDPGQAHPHDRSEGRQGHHGPHQGDRHLRPQGCSARPQGDQGRRPEGRRLTPLPPPGT